MAFLIYVTIVKFISVLSYLDFQVVDIMKVNVDKVLERDAKLSELDSRAGN